MCDPQVRRNLQSPEKRIANPIRFQHHDLAIQDTHDQKPLYPRRKYVVLSFLGQFHWIGDEQATIVQAPQDFEWMGHTGVTRVAFPADPITLLAARPSDQVVNPLIDLSVHEYGPDADCSVTRPSRNKIRVSLDKGERVYAFIISGAHRQNGFSCKNIDHKQPTCLLIGQEAGGRRKPGLRPG